MGLFIPPVVRATDANGNTLSQAKWYFYVTDTSTLTAVYQDSGLGSSHTNPVVADAGGLFAPIFLDPSITYRAVLKTSGGTVIQDIDPYNGATDQIGATPDAFGAVGDGVTDDAVALQAWLDAGGSLYLPPRLFRSSQKLIVRKHVLLHGVAHGFDSTLVAGGGGYAVHPGSRIKFDAGVSGLELQTSTTLTDPAAVASAGAGAFTQEGAFNSVIENIGLIGQGAGSACGFMARTFFHASNVQVYSFSGKGFDLNATTTVDGVAEYGNLSNSSMRDCGAWQCGSHGIHVRGRDANTCDIQNFNGFDNGGWGIVNDSLIPNIFYKPSLTSNTLGAIKANGSQSCFIVLPYIEPDAGEGCDLGNNNIVIGDVSALDTGNAPTQIAEISRFNQLHLQNTYAPAALAAEDAFIYKWDGLYLQGRGSTKDVTIVNKNGNVVATVSSGSTNWQVNGTSFANIFQSLGNNQSWPGVASGYIALLPNATNGAMLGGSGSTYDVGLTNSGGAVAAGILHGTTDWNVVGDYYRNGTKVVGARITGWAAATNTKSKATFDTTTVTVAQLAARVGQLIDDLMTHGVIGT